MNRFLVINIGGSALHIDTALQALVDIRQDGIHLLARQNDSTIPASLAALVDTGEADAPATDALAAIPDDAPLKNETDKKKADKPGRIQICLNRVSAGDNPVDICVASALTPKTLYHAASGQHHYHDQGGSPELWERYYAQYVEVWDRIIAADWEIPHCNEDNFENIGWTRSYLMGLEADRTSPLCEDSERHLQALRTALEEIEWRIQNVNTPGIPTGAPLDGPDLDTLIDWFEAEAEELIARHRDRDDDAAIKLYLAEMATDD
jgi:hypothetical protein